MSLGTSWNSKYRSRKFAGGGEVEGVFAAKKELMKCDLEWPVGTLIIKKIKIFLIYKENSEWSSC
jgi:hypothetical protein